MSRRRGHRGYQTGFYEQSENLHDVDARRAKAAKIIHCLEAEGLLAPGGAAVALDLGCANGLVVEALRPFARTVVGLDYDRDALRAAPTSVRRNAALVHGDAMALPFGDETVDLLVCAQVYEHVPDDTRLFKEIHRVLCPGGVAFFSGPNWLFPIEPHYGLTFLHWLPEVLADAWLRALGWGEHYYERSRTTWGLRRLLEGFVVRDVTTEAMRYVWAQRTDRPAALLARTPRWVWRAVAPFVPNVNWVLTKPDAHQ
jgi:SAM-dependent methyltransferase